MCNPASNYWPGKEKRAGQDIEIPAKDGSRIPLHISAPDGDQPQAVVLIIHDYFDPEGYYHDLADQFAAAGYLAVVPHFFHRHGKLAEQTHPAASARIPAVSDQEVFDDVDAVLEHLSTRRQLPTITLTGFCWGGRMAYLVAARHPEVRLLLPFYGHLGAWSGPDGNKPHSPLEEAGKIQATVVGSYGGGDDSIPLDGVAEMERRLRENGRAAELKVYDGAPHCFFRTPEWSKESDDAWSRVLAALGETAGAS
jgi:carboxymethylenebutenolidase